MNKKITLFLAVLFCAVVAKAEGSGIFIRGGVTNWGADPKFEFQTTDTEGKYVLENVELFGEFKVADANWSDACNYGGNGETPVLGEPYGLVAGGDSKNINLGEATYVCTKVTFTIDPMGNGILLIEGKVKSDDEPLAAVYVMGNLAGEGNSWNFLSEAGKLPVTETEGIFKGQVTFAADALAYWRIFEGLGQKGSWGLEAETTEHTLTATLKKGLEACVTTNPGTYDVTFNIATGEVVLVEGGSVLSLNADGIKVVAGKGFIEVLGANNVAVYNATGALVSRNANSNVAAGVYVVRADQKVAKVIVK